MTPDKQTYYADATSWATSETASVRRSRSVAWIVAVAVGLIAVFEAFALMSLAPLKSTRVVPVLVDRQTGFVEVLGEDGLVSLRGNAALTRSMLAQYVQAREGFNITTIGAEYHKVMLWSSGGAREAYAALMPEQNPNSPLRVYPRSTVVEVEIESVSDLSPKTALVRFTTRRRDGEAQSGPLNRFAAVVSYNYSENPLRAEDRLVNPLGFQVVRYQRDDDVAPAPDSSTPSQPGSRRAAGARPNEATTNVVAGAPDAGAAGQPPRIGSPLREQ